MPSHSAASASFLCASHTYVVFFRGQGVRTPLLDLADGGSGQGLPVRLKVGLELCESSVLLHLWHDDGGNNATDAQLDSPQILSNKAGGGSLADVGGERSHKPPNARHTSSTKRAGKTTRRGTRLARNGGPLQSHHYTISLTEMSPVAAHFPLSEELRSRLHLDVVDRDAVTYSSHSTPHMGVSCLTNDEWRKAPSVVPLSLSMPPSHGLAPLSGGTRDSSSPAYGGRSVFSRGTSAAYGQYLEVKEPFLPHTRSPPSPSLTKLNKSSPPQERNCGSLDGECAVAPPTPRDGLLHAKHKTNRSLHTPPVEQKCTQRILSVTQLGTPSLSISTPPPTGEANLSVSMTDALYEYEDLLTIAFVGAAQSVSTDCSSSFTEDASRKRAQGEKKRFGYAKVSRSLIGWVHRLKKKWQRTPTSSAVSSSSETPSDDLGHSSKKVGRPRGKAPSDKGSLQSPQSPALTSTAHEDPERILEMSLPVNQAQTFYLQFLRETEMRAFLSCYVTMQSSIKESQEKKSTTAEPDERTGSDVTAVELSDLSRARVDDIDHVFASVCDEHLRDRDANHLCDAVSSGYKGKNSSMESISTVCFGDSAVAGATGGVAEGHEEKRRDTAARAPAAGASAVFGSEGWQEYVRHKMDPRYGLPFATVPLFLWNSFLPLASLVLYTCHRGFLIVERLLPLSSLPQSEDEKLNVSPPERQYSQKVLKSRGDKARCSPLLTAEATYEKKGGEVTLSRRQRCCRDSRGTEESLSTPHLLQTWESSHCPSSSSSSCESELLGLPASGGANYEESYDHLTAFKDVFLCLSESYILFVNSFGRLCFHCRFDEIALMTHSAVDESLTRYPFIFFRLKPSEVFDAPTFALTFTNLPDVPDRGRVAKKSAPQPSAHGGRLAQRNFASLASSASSPTAPHLRQDSSRARASASKVAVGLLSSRERKRLLSRHGVLLQIFEAVCPRPLERHSLGEFGSCTFDKTQCAYFKQLISGASVKVSSSPLLTKPSNGCNAASSQTPPPSSDLLPCVEMAAEDVRTIKSKVHQPPKAHLLSLLLPRASWNLFSEGKGPRSRLRALLTPTASTVFRANHFTEAVPRWGHDDPGLLLYNVNQDMDFSLERATRTMPLLASKDEVCHGYTSPLHESMSGSTYLRLSGSHSWTEKMGWRERSASVTESWRAEDMYAPVAAKRRDSSFVRRTAMKDL